LGFFYALNSAAAWQGHTTRETCTASLWATCGKRVCDGSRIPYVRFGEGKRSAVEALDGCGFLSPFEKSLALILKGDLGGFF